MKDRAPYETAAREAWEEAGVVGVVSPRSCGSFRHAKRSDGRLRYFSVEVFPLAVTAQFDVWPEQTQRATRWLPAAQAAVQLDNSGLARLVADFAAGRQRREDHALETA